MNSYELTVILSKKDTDDLKGKVKSILDKHGMKIEQELDWGVKRLAYEVEGEREGFYYHLLTEGDPASVIKILNDFKLTGGILRHLFVKLKKKKTA